MKRFLSIIFLSIPAMAQSYKPQAFLLYDTSGNPYPSGSGTSLSYTPPAFTCYTIVTGSVVPCTFSAGGSGTVTSVALTGSGTLFSSTPGTAVTTSGTLNVDAQVLAQAANCVLAGPATGSAAGPTCRVLVNADFPSGLTFTSPTFITPALGTPISGAITNLTGTCTGCTSNAVAASLTMNNGGSGAASGSTFNGSAAVTLSYNTLGAAPLASPTFTGTVTAPLIVNNGTGAASTSVYQMSGTCFTGGSGTTTFPCVMLQPSTATSETGWSTSGTMLGINAHTGLGNIIDVHIDNGASIMTFTPTANLTVTGGYTGASFTVSPTTGPRITSSNIQLGSVGLAAWSSTTNSNGTLDTGLDRNAAGVVEVNLGTAQGSGGSLKATGIIAASYQQTAASSTGGTCAMSTGTSCTITIGHTYTTPVCIATQQSATLTGGAVGCTVSGTTVTITSAVANSETWGAFVFGNPN